MLSNISWTSYWQALALSFLLYYVVIITLYYKVAISVWLRGKLSFTAPKNISGQNLKLKERPEILQPELFAHDENLQVKAGKDVCMDAIGAAVDEIRAYLVQIGKEQFVKEELVYCLQRILKKYPYLKGSPFQSSLTHFIAFELESNCSISLSEEEVHGLWKG